MPIIDEGHFVPFEAAPLPAAPWLVFAPHADDETFGLGGTLALAADAGIAAHLVVATDGALGGEADDLVATRRAEVDKAADILGLASVDFWNEPDRGLLETPRLVHQAVAAIRRHAPAHVFFPACFEYHPDHRAMMDIAWAALRQLFASDPSSVPAPVSYEISVHSPINTLIDITATFPRKMAAAATYCSQLAANNYLEVSAGLSASRSLTLPGHVRHAEGFYIHAKDSLAKDLRSVTDERYNALWER